MKSEKGITLIALVATIVVMMILVAAAVRYGNVSMKSVQLKNFSFELQQIKGEVDTIYEKIKLGETNYITGYGRDITVSTEAVQTLKKVKQIDYDSLSVSQRETCYEGERTTYRYFSEADVKKTFDISSNPGAVIINFKTREVISVKGFDYDGDMYYTLDQIKY